MTVDGDRGFIAGADDLFFVETTGGEYLVDAREGVCACPDSLYSEDACKHVLRVAFETGARPLPTIDPGEVDAPLRPRLPVTDGGDDAEPEPAVDDEAADADADADADRPDDCACHPGDDLECWPCARVGFEEPNPAPDPSLKPAYGSEPTELETDGGEADE